MRQRGSGGDLLCAAGQAGRGLLGREWLALACWWSSSTPPKSWSTQGQFRAATSAWSVSRHATTVDQVVWSVSRDRKGGAERWPFFAEYQPNENPQPVAAIHICRV